jgi:hypothetical protein
MFFFVGKAMAFSSAEIGASSAHTFSSDRDGGHNRISASEEGCEIPDATSVGC